MQRLNPVDDFRYRSRGVGALDRPQVHNPVRNVALNGGRMRRQSAAIRRRGAGDSCRNLRCASLSTDRSLTRRRRTSGRQRGRSRGARRRRRFVAVLPVGQDADGFDGAQETVDVRSRRYADVVHLGRRQTSQLVNGDESARGEVGGVGGGQTQGSQEIND